MRAGEMDRLIVIEQEISTRGSSGGQKKSWVRFARVWASVRQVSGNELFLSEQTQAFARTIFRIHYRPGIKLKMRIFYNDDNYDIQSKKELGRREGIEITAVAEVK